MVKVLVVAQLPPPYLGQPIMLANLVGSKLADIEWCHVSMRLSEEVSDVGAFKFWKTFRLFPILMRVIYARFAWRPDIFYFAPAGANRMSMFRDFVILIPARLIFHKVVFHFHASGHSALYSKLPAWQKVLFRLAYFRPEAAVRLSELTPPDPAAIEVRREYIVPNGIADPAIGLSPRKKAETVSAENPLRLLFISSLQEGKGLLVLMDACGRLAERGVPFQLDVMGRFISDEFERQTRDRVTQLGLGDRVQFLGQLTGAEKFSAFERADVLCHPTHYDTLPIVLIEAMGLSLPVVSTLHSGIPSIVDDGETGFLVPTRDAASVADRVARLAQDSALRDRMGAAGRAKFEREFTLERYTGRMRDVFLAVATPQRVDERPAVQSGIGVAAVNSST